MTTAKAWLERFRTSQGSEHQHFIGFNSPIADQVHAALMDAFDVHGRLEPASLHASRSGGNSTAADNGSQHAFNVVIPIRGVLIGDRTLDAAPHQKDAQVQPLALRQILL